MRISHQAMSFMGGQNSPPTILSTQICAEIMHAHYWVRKMNN